MDASIRIRPEYVKEYVEPPLNSSRYIMLEATRAGLSRYLIVNSSEDIIDKIADLPDRLPRSIRPAAVSEMLYKRTPQKLLMLLSEGRHLVPGRSLVKMQLPPDIPAFEYIAKRLLSPVPDVDDVIRMLAAIEDRKALDENSYVENRNYISNILTTYLAGVLYSITPRSAKNKLKLLSSHVRLKAIDAAKAWDRLDRIYKNKKVIDGILSNAARHIRARNNDLLNYTRGDQPAAFLVYTRDNLNVAYVYEILDMLGQQGYDVKDVIVAYDFSSKDIAERVSKTLKRLGDVRSRTLLIPETPGNLIAAFLKHLINKYEMRGMKLFIDGRGGSPAAFLAVLRNFRDRLVLPDRRDFLLIAKLLSCIRTDCHLSPHQFTGYFIKIYSQDREWKILQNMPKT